MFYYQLFHCFWVWFPSRYSTYRGIRINASFPHSRVDVVNKESLQLIPLTPSDESFARRRNLAATNYRTKVSFAVLSSKFVFELNQVKL
jgi:hypothetical protein